MQLTWQQLLPTLEQYLPLFKHAHSQTPLSAMALQYRLKEALTLFLDKRSKSRLMLLKAPNTYHYLALIGNHITTHYARSDSLVGAHYHIEEHHITYHPAQTKEDNFVADAYCLFDEALTYEQLFGTVYRHRDTYQLIPGLIHRANGGVLVLSLKTLLEQPKLWEKLKQTVMSGRFDWQANHVEHPLPIAIPPMPIDLKLILIGDRLMQAEFQEIEHALVSVANYGEFESERLITNDNDIIDWCRYLNGLCQTNQLPPLSEEAYATLLRLATRFTGDQLTLPLSPCWLTKQLEDAYAQAPHLINQLTAEQIQHASHHVQWQQNYLFMRSRSDVEQQQITVMTQGNVIGQINALSVVEYPGYPLAIGEVSRISCVLNLGDGDLIDVERKAELGGNLHAKGMMIMHAFICSALALEQQLPFSASIVFEQSYGEVDGDSASLAELCVILSALAQQPIDQQLAITGSIDQFGNVQPIGGINEKIEAFFDICQFRGLTGHQGVIIPKRNLQHLIVNDAVLDAVKLGHFHLYAIEHVSQAIPILMHMPYSSGDSDSVLARIQQRVNHLTLCDKTKSPWFLKWLN